MSNLDAMTAYWRKLSSSILASSVWSEAASTRLVWITMIAMSDQIGHVLASVPGLARLAGVPLDDAVEAVRVLSSPDVHDRSKVLDGRRITPVDGGWLLVNFARYQDAAKAEAARARKREWWERNRSPRREARQLDLPARPLDHSERESETEDKDRSPAEPEGCEAKAKKPRKPITDQAGLIGDLARAWQAAYATDDDPAPVPEWGGETARVNTLATQHGKPKIVAAFAAYLADPYYGGHTLKAFGAAGAFGKCRQAGRKGATKSADADDPAMAKAMNEIRG